MLRIGVTGHRSYDAPDDVEAAIGAVVTDVVATSDEADIEIWSSLAEGADRVVARLVADRSGAVLVAVLPLEPDDYRSDFADSTSSDEFDDLLAMASTVTVTGPDASGTRTSAYLRAGLAVAAAVDVLIAVWDGAPARGTGGTAEVVHAAQAAGTPVVVVPVTRTAVRS